MSGLACISFSVALLTIGFGGVGASIFWFGDWRKNEIERTPQSARWIVGFWFAGWVGFGVLFLTLDKCL